MLEFLRGRRGRLVAIIFVTLIAAYFRIGYVLSITGTNYILGDAVQYYFCAYNLVHHGIFSISRDVVPISDSFRDPGLPWLIYLGIKLTDDDRAVNLVIGTLALLSALTVGMTMQIASRFLSMPFAIMIGLIMAIWPHLTTSCGHLLTETLSGCFITAAIFFLAPEKSTNSISPSRVLGCLFMGLAALTNSVLLLFPFIAVFSLWRTSAISMKNLVIILCLSLCAPMAWQVRNFEVNRHNPNPVAGRGTMNLVQGMIPELTSSYRAYAVDKDSDAIKLYAEADQLIAQANGHPKILFDQLFSRFSREPLRYLRWYFFDKPTSLWGWSIMVGIGDIYVFHVANSPYDSKPLWILALVICHALNAVLGILAGVALILFFRSVWKDKDLKYLASDRAFANKLLARNYSEAQTLVVALFCYITVIYSIFQAEPRYSIPFKGFEIILAFAMLSTLALNVRNLLGQSQNRS